MHSANSDENVLHICFSNLQARISAAVSWILAAEPNYSETALELSVEYVDMQV